MNYAVILKELRSITDEVVLFHSATGKDSIMLCHILNDSFKVFPVFMFLVKGLEYEEKMILWAEKTYNIKFIRTPHYALNSFIKHGYLGLKQDKSIENNKISKIDKNIKTKMGVQWSIYGFKKIDGITRRLMINQTVRGISYNTKKCYPLMDYKNSDISRFISDNNLPPSFCYNKNKPSSGCDISDPTFLHFIKQKYPEDLKKIFNQFPLAEAILFRYETEKR